MKKLTLILILVSLTSGCATGGFMEQWGDNLAENARQRRTEPMAIKTPQNCIAQNWGDGLVHLSCN